MHDQTDAQLLQAYAEHHSEPAFAELVRRHVDLVHSAARRMVGDAHLAQDVSQATFVALAKSAAQLTDRPVLAGWLHRTAQNIAAQTVRTDVRRRAREQRAVAMNELLTAEPDVSWEQIAPHLDAALGELTESDHDILLLSYFEGKTAREMAQILGISDEAAQKRARRAVERLRDFFAKRGITVGTSGLILVITANAVQAAPVGLALTIATAAALTGTTVATAATITATKAIAMTAFQKSVVTATIAVLAGVGIYEARQNSKLHDQVQSFQQQQALLAEQNQQLQFERDEASRRIAALRENHERLNSNSSELLKLRAQVNSLLQRNQELGFLAGAVTNSAVKVPIDETKYVIPESWEHAGQDSATAAVRTSLWAMAHRDIAKLMDVLWIPEEVKESLTKQMMQSAPIALKGARITETQAMGHNNDEFLFMVESIEELERTAESGESLGLVKSVGQPRPILVRRFQDVWRVVPNVGSVPTPEEIGRSHAEPLTRETSEAPQ